MNQLFRSDSVFLLWGHHTLTFSCPPSCHDWDTPSTTSHPTNQPVLPFGLCHSEQPFVLSCPALLQIEVVNTFKSGTSFQGAGALRRQSSTTSQTQDVTNVSSPSHVSLSNALSSPTSTTAATAPPTTGRESELCQSASPLFASGVPSCHEQKVIFCSLLIYLFLIYNNSLHLEVGISEVFFFFVFRSCYLRFHFLYFFCLFLVHAGFQIHLDISSHGWVYCLLIGECVFVSSEC